MKGKGYRIFDENGEELKEDAAYFVMRLDNMKAGDYEAVCAAILTYIDRAPFSYAAFAVQSLREASNICEERGDYDEPKPENGT